MMQAIKGSPGYSLVEFLVAMLILALVSLSWLTIAQVQSANRESYRREAVERLAGMMDAISQLGLSYVPGTALQFKDGQPQKLSGVNGRMTVNPLFGPTESSLGYRLRVKELEEVGDLMSLQRENDRELSVLEAYSPVLVGEVFEQWGTLDREEYAPNEKTNLGYRIWRVAVALSVE